MRLVGTLCVTTILASVLWATFTSGKQKQVVQDTQQAAVVTARKLKPPKPFHTMTLKELAAFQKRAYAHYRGTWRFWVNHRQTIREEYGVDGIDRCRGAIAPHWACWSLEASIWTKRELGETQAKLEMTRLRSMGMNDFGTAARFSDRIFPGVYSWLMSCSGGEGGHGGFVMNHQGSGAGGNMQFMFGTYDAYDNEAIKEANRRGARLPSVLNNSYFGWHSPLGQAITAAYMRAVVGNSHYHWAPSIDSACW